MNQQEALEARYKRNLAASAEATTETPQKDPFPRMIIVCIAITFFLLFVIMGFLFYDLVIRRPTLNVRPDPTPTVQIGAPEGDFRR